MTLKVVRDHADPEISQEMIAAAEKVFAQHAQPGQKVDAPELLRSIYAAMFRVHEAQQPSRSRRSFCIGHLILRPTEAEALWKGRAVGLTLMEFNVVHHLARCAGQYFSYRAIYDRMRYEGFLAGDGDEGVRTNVRSTIRRIRAKFAACDDDEFSEIENFERLGYRWKMRLTSAWPVAAILAEDERTQEHEPGEAIPASQLKTRTP